MDRITVRDGDEGNPRLLNITMIGKVALSDGKTFSLNTFCCVNSTNSATE